ncbi:hypothetical protein A1O1_08158 [Capronia coronata CBS 617.96]|uniref:Xylanolytic transcriptional activator regulatory domain-containing protein n=1 Tax=Capronia coronata CBS 617.96 TaxID=1182541 RepID=W9YIG3_9EURO|nr:uncharacterized protein A1O1_08158 [Capronia coronata CBS 617.96]EXJ82089.1 hypothetical protein A1O1_08158 [Capronia coronata CBS 617.96]
MAASGADARCDSVTVRLQHAEIVFAQIEDPSTKRRHPRGYIEFLEQHNSSLENHVAFLERTIRDSRPDVDLDLLQNGSATWNGNVRQEDGNAVVAAASEVSGDYALQTSPSQGTASNASPSEAVTTDQATDDSSSLELLCLRSAGAEPHFFGASSGYSFTKMFSASLRSVREQAPGLTLSGIVEKTCVKRTTPTPAPLPNRPIVNMLTTAYFEQVHPQFPFLHRPTYEKWEEEVLAASESGKTPNPTYAFFVYALCAVGALTGPLAGATLPEGLYAAAENLFEHVMLQNSLESIQAILACAMYSLRSPVGVSVWMLSGLALRQCLELGLHRKIRWSKMKPDLVKDELRKRVFWCAYNLDRAVAITLGRPVGITDHDIDVEFPSDINDEDITIDRLLREPRRSHTEPATTVSSAIHTIRLRQLWAKMQSVVYTQVGAEASIGIVEAMKKEFTMWLESAPEQLASNRMNNNAFASREWFSLMYHHSILLLYRHRLVQPRGVSTSASVFTDCAHSSQAICMIYKQLYLSQRLNDTWGALHVLFLAGVTFLHCLWSSPETRAAYRPDKVSTICTSIMIVLAVMSERWTAVEAYRDSFEMLSTATQTMLYEISTASAASTAPSGPVISSEGGDQFTDYLSYMTEIGMCATVEELLSTMVE